MNRQSKSLVIVSVLLTALNCGCNLDATPSPAPKVEPEERFLVHVVTSRGQTLAKIAKWYTGTTGTSKKIEDANVGGIGKTLKVGQRLLIPMDLVRNHQPYGTSVSKPRVTSTRKPTVTPVSRDDGGESKQSGPKAGPKSSPTPSPTVSAIDPAFSKISPAVVPMNTPAIATPPPVQPDSEAEAAAEKVNASISSEMERTVEQMIREEQAQVEKLRRELGTKDQPQ